MRYILWFLFYFGLFLYGVYANAGDWRLLEAQEVNLGFKSFFPGGRDPLLTQNGLPDRTMGKEISVEIKTTALNEIVYFDNYVHGASDEDTKNGGGQFRAVGYQFRLGVNLSDYIQVGYFHHSQHVIDTTYKPGFPVQDAFEVKLNIYKRR